MGGGAGGEDDWVADDATRYVFFVSIFFTLLICTTTNGHSLHQITPIFTPSTCFYTNRLFLHQPPVFTPTACFYTNCLFFAPTALFFYQPPVFHPICTQLPRLPFPRGPNNEMEFRHLCPRLETHLEPWVSFYFYFYVL